MGSFRYGDVVWADRYPAAGSEQNKRRPVVVVSNDKFNAHCNLTMVVPITSTDSGYALHVDVGQVPSEGDEPPIRGFAEAEQLKSLDLDFRHAVKVGSISEDDMAPILSVVLGCLVSPDMMIV